MTDINANLKSQQRAARNHIESIRIASGSLAADCYVSGLLLGITEYMIERYGRAAAYDYLAGFADDVITPELP
jgi:hypothetical protein